MPDIKPQETLKAASRSVKWATIAEIVSKATTPVLYLILASILSPNDFGVISASFILINFSQVIWDAGFGKSLIQTDLPVEKVANPVFWLNFIFSLLIYAFVFLFSPQISAFLNVPEAAKVLPVLGIQIIFQSLVSVPQAVMVREFEFKSILVAKLSNSLIPIIIAIPLALLNFGVWALVAGYVSGSILNTVVYWKVSKWRPSFTIDWKYLNYIKRFGFWSFVEGLSSWFFSWGDNFIVGKFLGAYFLGVYTIGWNVVSMVFGLVINPLVQIIYSTFSRIKHDSELIRVTYHKVLGYILFITFPIALLFFTLSSLLIPAWVSDKWQNIIIVIKVIGLLYGCSSLVSINPELYRALGLPDLNAKLMIAFIAIYLPVYLLVISFGFESFLYARLILGALTLPVHFIIVRKVITFNWNNFFRNYLWLFAGLVEMIFLVVLLKQLFAYFLILDLYKGIIIIIIALAIFVLNTQIFRPHFIGELIKSLGLKNV